ncbi:efflux RND transporter periplasmic adaptor subunit [Variovorax sp. HJSM1_2]|uniref:efflux RND transporter periplasmic adaptor subunit n=1 Tax=Variovorax sp. HJSM1_2 TaxID=3366263 RepID=UPI003BC2EA25
MASKIFYSVVAVVGIAAASGGAWWLQQPGRSAGAAASGGAAEGEKGASSKPAPASSVEVANVAVTRVVDDVQTVGSLRSRQSVVLRPEISGRVVQINFRDGERVRRGQLLVQLDDKLQQAQVQQSEAELSIANANHKRNQDLLAQNFISQRAVDESSANLQVAQAKLELARATAARLKIVAPFDGMAGIRQVNVGDYLKDGADIVNIEDMDALYVDFRLPERFQPRVQRGQRASLELDALPGQKFAAVVLAIDPLVDANGRSVGVRGCIDNRQQQLRPGMFARVSAVFGERQNALTVPEEAIVPQGGRQFVLRLLPGPDAGTLVTQRVEVKVGVRRPGQVEIVSGLSQGDRVVTAGQQRLQKDGSPVRVVDLASKTATAGPSGNGNRNGQEKSAADAAAAKPAGNANTDTASARAGNPCLTSVSHMALPMQPIRPVTPGDSAAPAPALNPMNGPAQPNRSASPVDAQAPKTGTVAQSRVPA